MNIEKENRAHIVNVAKSYMGAVGGSSAHADILHFFNTVKPQGYTARNGVAWCAIFASACAIQAFGKKDAISYFPLSASCSRIIKEAKAKSIWIEKDSYKPEQGDFILYDWDDKKPTSENKHAPEHVGIVEKINEDSFTVIEGNCGNKVKRRTVKFNGKFIRGFVTPHYDRIVSKVSKKSDNEIIKEILSGKWGVGSVRKKALIGSGYDYSAIQKELTRIIKLTEKTLAGKYGVGEERKKALGKDYAIVQWNINRIYKEKEK